MAYVALNIKGIPVAKLLLRTKHIVSCLKENKVIFNDLPIPTWELEEMVKEFDELAAAGIDKNGLSVLQRDEHIVFVKDTLRDLANYVQLKSKGNRTVILKAGMQIKKTGTYTRKDIAAPYGLKIKNTNMGIPSSLHWKSDKNVMNYIEYSHTPEEDTSWRRYAFSTKQKVNLTNLEHKKEYAFRVMSVTAGATSAFSNIITCYG